MMRTLIADQNVQAGESPVVVVSLSLPDGRVLRFATRPLTLESQAGAIQVSPLLLGVSDFREEMDYFGLQGIGSLLQVAVEFVTPEDLAGMASSWGNTATSKVEVATLWEGQDWEDRVVLMAAATVQELELGVDGGVTRLVAESAPPAAGSTVGDDTRDISVDWGTGNLSLDMSTVSDATGVTYNTVFGCPRSVPVVKIGDQGGATNYMVFAGHRIGIATGVANLDLYEDGVYVAPGGVVSEESYTRTTSVATGNGSDGGMTAGFTSVYTRGGAYRADAPEGTISAGHVLRALLVRSRVKVDWAMCAPCLAALGEWTIGFWTDAEADALDMIRSYILPYYPIVEMSGVEGLYYVYADPTVLEAEGTLTLGQNLLSRVGGITYTDADAVRNTFTLQYSREEFAGIYASSVSLDSDNSRVCFVSQQHLATEGTEDAGVREDDPAECASVWDSGTAYRVLLVRAARLATQRRVLRYVVSPDTYWITPGSAYRIVDADAGIDEQVGVVTAVDRSLVPFEIAVTLLEGGS